MHPRLVHMAFAVAILLLCGPEPQDSKHSQFAPIVRDAAMALQLMDVKETRYVFNKPEEFPVDLKMMQVRLRELINAPWVESARYLRSREAINEAMVFNRSFNHHVRMLNEIYPHSQAIQNTLIENEQLYQIWDAMRDAQCDYYYIHIRRRALLKLQELLGEELIPPPIPVWRFR